MFFLSSLVVRTTKKVGNPWLIEKNLLPTKRLKFTALFEDLRELGLKKIKMDYFGHFFCKTSGRVGFKDFYMKYLKKIHRITKYFELDWTWLFLLKNILEPERAF